MLVFVEISTESLVFVASLLQVGKGGEVALLQLGQVAWHDGWVEDNGGWCHIQWLHMFRTGSRRGCGDCGLPLSCATKVA
jgi:hypothetical protein